MLKIKAVRPEWVTLIASAFLLTAFNFVLWQHLFEITTSDGKGIVMRVAFGAMILAAFNIVLTLLAFKRVEAGADADLHDQRRGGVFHESIRCTD